MLRRQPGMQGSCLSPTPEGSLGLLRYRSPRSWQSTCWAQDPDWVIKRTAGEVSFSDDNVVAAANKWKHFVDEEST